MQKIKRIMSALLSTVCAAMASLSCVSGTVVYAQASQISAPTSVTESGQRVAMMPRGVNPDSIEIQPNVLFVFDAENKRLPRADYIRSVTADISKSGSTATLTGAFSSSYTGSLTIRLQRRASSSDSWEDVDSWSEKYSTAGIHAFEEQYTLEKGYQYRVKTVAAVYGDDGSFLESAYSYSRTITY